MSDKKFASISFSLPQNLLKLLDEIASSSGLSRSEFVRSAVIQHINLMKDLIKTGSDVNVR